MMRHATAATTRSGQACDTPSAMPAEMSGGRLDTVASCVPALERLSTADSADEHWRTEWRAHEGRRAAPSQRASEEDLCACSGLSPPAGSPLPHSQGTRRRSASIDLLLAGSESDDSINGHSASSSPRLAERSLFPAQAAVAKLVRPPSQSSAAAASDSAAALGGYVRRSGVNPPELPHVPGMGDEPAPLSYMSSTSDDPLKEGDACPCDGDAPLAADLPAAADAASATATDSFATLGFSRSRAMSCPSAVSPMQERRRGLRTSPLVRDATPFAASDASCAERVDAASSSADADADPSGAAVVLSMADEATMPRKASRSFSAPTVHPQLLSGRISLPQDDSSHGGGVERQAEPSPAAAALAVAATDAAPFAVTAAQAVASAVGGAPLNLAVFAHEPEKTVLPVHASLGAQEDMCEEYPLKSELHELLDHSDSDFAMSQLSPVTGPVRRPRRGSKAVASQQPLHAIHPIASARPPSPLLHKGASTGASNNPAMQPPLPPPPQQMPALPQTATTLSSPAQCLHPSMQQSVPQQLQQQVQQQPQMLPMLQPQPLPLPRAAPQPAVLQQTPLPSALSHSAADGIQASTGLPVGNQLGSLPSQQLPAFSLSLAQLAQGANTMQQYAQVGQQLAQQFQPVSMGLSHGADPGSVCGSCGTAPHGGSCGTHSGSSRSSGSSAYCTNPAIGAPSASVTSHPAWLPSPSPTPKSELPLPSAIGNSTGLPGFEALPEFGTAHDGLEVGGAAAHFLGDAGAIGVNGILSGCGGLAGGGGMLASADPSGRGCRMPTGSHGSMALFAAGGYGGGSGVDPHTGLSSLHEGESFTTAGNSRGSSGISSPYSNSPHDSRHDSRRGSLQTNSSSHDSRRSSFGSASSAGMMRRLSPTSTTNAAAQRQAMMELERMVGGAGNLDRSTCNQELKRMQSLQQWRESRQMMSLMGRAGMPADVGRYNALILWYKKNKQWSEALAMLSEMKVAGAKPSIVSYNSVIDACGKARQLKVAFELLEQVGRESLTADTVTYTSLIDACGKAQQLERAFALLAQMKSVGVRPNSFTYNALIDACSKAAKVDRAFEVLREMGHEGIQPNTTTYTALIDACGKSQQLERAFLILNLMQREGVKPNTATYTCLVDACGKAQQLERAFEVLRMMQDARVQANTHTFNALIDACGKARQLDRAFAVLSEMQRAGVRPDAVSYTCLIDACGRSMAIERAIEVVRQMQHAGLRPNTAAFTSLIDACGKALELERAFRVVDYMSQIGVSPNTATYTSLIDACGRAQQIDRAFALFQHMQSLGVPPNAATFTTLISVCSKCGELDKALVVLSQMSAANVPPDTITYTALINACSRTRQVDRAFELLAQMTTHGLRPNLVTFNALVDVCCKCGDIARAESAVSYMQAEGQMPDATTFNMLIHACCKFQHHERVLSLLGMMRNMRIAPNAVTMNNLATSFSGDRQALEQALVALQELGPPSSKPPVA